MSENEFSVYQFFPDETYERVRSFVSIEEAMQAAVFYTTNVASRIGVTQRVIITDGGDCTVFEWKTGEGIVWPEGLRSEDKSSDVRQGGKAPVSGSGDNGGNA
jgi:hypothetical protein